MEHLIKLPESLERLSAQDFEDLALSVYVPTDPGAGHHYYSAQLQDLARAERHKLSPDEEAAVDREIPRVLSALAKHRFDTPAVAAFSCGPAELIDLWRLPAPVAGRISVGRHVDLAPISLQLFEHPAALAAVVDKQEARLFGLVLGEIAELAHVEGTRINRHHQGGWSATAFQRREDEHTRRNEAVVAEAVTELLGQGYRRLIVAGPPEARTALLRCLPEHVSRDAITGAARLESPPDELRRRLWALSGGGVKASA